MPGPYYISDLIPSTECVGNSLTAINISLSSLDVNLQQLSAYSAQLIADTPVVNVLRSAPNVCFTKVGKPTTYDTHLFGGIGPGQYDNITTINSTLSTWSSCLQKLPYITTALSGSHIRFPALSSSTDYDDQLKLAVFDSYNTLHMSSAVNLFKNKLTIKDITGSTIVAGASALKFTSTVTSDGQEAIIGSSNLTLESSLISLYNSSTNTSDSTSIDLTLVSGYNDAYTMVYLYYDTSLSSSDTGMSGILNMTVNGFPTGSVATQAGNKDRDTGYVFIKIPISKQLAVVKSASYSSTSRFTITPPTFSARLYLYGWST